MCLQNPFFDSDWATDRQNASSTNDEVERTLQLGKVVSSNTFPSLILQSRCCLRIFGFFTCHHPAVNVGDPFRGFAWLLMATD
jgi:hypothetical protein